jgi:4'-phosphopantetheinyl transferase
MTATETLIYSIAYPNRVPDGAFGSLLDRMPGAIVQKITRYRRWEDAHASLFGKLLLMTALAEAGSTATLHDLQYNAFQRPFLDKGPDFNITHSGNRVACILGRTGRVGIDLEAIRPMPIEDFRQQFTQGEWAAITGAPESMSVFYHYWTAKESLIKADGRGLNIPLDQLVIDQGPGIVLGDREWQLRRIDAFMGYACHIATEGSCEPIIKEMSLAEILTGK